jgi:hypothetical protein
MTLVWTPGFNYDTNASAYIDAVEAADGQALETATRYAINDFVIGCKNDGIWTAIKASCILAGARTLAGALVPLVGTAPTNVSFVSGDYNRKTGLIGNASTKYLNLNRTPNDDPLDSVHFSTYVNSVSSAGGHDYIGSTETSASPSVIYQIIDNVGTGLACNIGTDTGVLSGLGNTRTGFYGGNRPNATTVQLRVESATSSATINSASKNSSLNYFLFGRNLNGSANRLSTRRHCFYSIGESLNLAQLDTRVTALINAFAAAIP